MMPEAAFVGVVSVGEVIPFRHQPWRVWQQQLAATMDNGGRGLGRC